MDRLQHTVLLLKGTPTDTSLHSTDVRTHLVYEGPLLLGVGPPQEKDNSRAAVVDPVNHGVCQPLPSLHSGDKERERGGRQWILYQVPGSPFPHGNLPLSL